MAKVSPINGQTKAAISPAVPPGPNADGLPADLVQVLQGPVNAYEVVGIQQVRIVQLERALNIAIRELQRSTVGAAHSARGVSQP